MPTAQQDTEITLGTGRMLAIFFAFVLVCAVFFALGFSLGRRTSMAGAGSLLSAPSAVPATIVRPSAAKNGAPQTTPQSNSSDFSFYKAVGEKNADSALTPQGSAAVATPAATSPTADGAPKTATDAAISAPAPPTSGSYYVQVAAVSRQEDADALVEALKKKQYPAFTANNTAGDKFYHVQVGPFAELKEAEAMRARLIGDGYNPIVKK
ncbi:Sporulation related protein [Candidatus Sulfotelmatobacter kueseliae]|uniref:Sporulation related protein n=1 Tax=Candidatus Sulfotelmatobacter kueseliae TaxID=2042962 RepID=A0A2U3L274_9BACT|nr:Sporulation related protein [Candidatus Sulfotelmatobacter kueseliae]